jgi:hypothetical protein
LWPTPNAGNWGSSTGHNGERVPFLGTAVKRWPTPKARDWKDGKSAGTFGRSSPDLGKVVEQSAANGALNPTWVEWLMGFPLGWTDCEHLATRSSRRSWK